MKHAITMSHLQTSGRVLGLCVGIWLTGCMQIQNQTVEPLDLRAIPQAERADHLEAPLADSASSGAAFGEISCESCGQSYFGEIAESEVCSLCGGPVRQVKEPSTQDGAE